MNRRSRAALALAWGSMLLLSLLPNILYQEITGTTPQWLLPGKYLLLTALLWLTFFWAPAKRLRSLYLVFVVIFLVEDLLLRLGHWEIVQLWLNRSNFTLELLDIQVRKMAAALIIILAMLGLGYRRQDFFLRRGELAAPANPMPIFGFSKATHWKRLGPTLAVYIGGAILLMMGVVSRPDAAAWQGLLPMLPAILGLAAMNAFAEEISYRAALLAPSHKALGSEQAIRLSAAYFGISRFYGVPNGLIGVLLAAFFGWVLGRAMLESRGLFWPWLIHLVADVVIFSFMAMGAVAPGSP